MVGAFPLVLILVSLQAPDFPKFDRSEERGIRVHRSVGLLYVVVMLRSLFVCLLFKGNSFIPNATCQGLKWNTLSHFLNVI